MSRLDEWLGRSTLKERIAELEEEADRLRDRYEAESERRAEAVRDHQEAAERVNRLQDRIAQLEGELEREGASDEELSVRRRDRLRGEALDAVLDRLQSVRAPPEGALTATVRTAGDVPELVADVLDDRTRLVADAAPCLCCVDDRALVAVTLSPPFTPAVQPTWDARFELRDDWFRPTDQGLLALVRADVFAVGRYADGQLTFLDGVESDVMGTHSKGGFSQDRFERRREEQVDAHLEAAHSVFEDAIEDGTVDETLVLTGQADALERLSSAIDASPDATRTVDATGKPEDALQDAFRDFWTTELRVL